MGYINNYFNLLIILIILTTFAIILFLFKHAGIEQQELLQQAILNSHKIHDTNLEPRPQNYYSKIFFHQELNINGNSILEPVKLKKANTLTEFIENVECSFLKSSRLKCLRKANRIYFPLEYLQKRYDVKLI